MNLKSPKVLKWLFFFLWILCLVAFFIGQMNTPPNYANIPGNPWGNLFGSTFILGVISFILALIFISKDNNSQVKPQKVKVDEKRKYNLSVKRIFSRLFLTGVVGIIFGVAMFPFLTVADGLLYEQRAAIGGQNFTRMVLLWGLFTLIFSLLSFWKKRFRMTSFFLMGCWIISLGFLAITNMQGANNYRCTRSTAYQMPNEFNRALDLISQRVGVDTPKANRTLFQSIYNFKNCLDIQYLDTNDKNVEAYFQVPRVKDQQSLQHLHIMVNPSYKNFDDLTLAVLLSHEIIHAGQYINEVVGNTSLSCFEQETKAYTAQQYFLVTMNDEERRSIYARLRENVSINPTFSIILLTEEMAKESTQACTELQQKNSLTEVQTNSCSWEGLESKLLKYIREDEYYQQQCNQN